MHSRRPIGRFATPWAILLLSLTIAPPLAAEPAPAAASAKAAGSAPAAAPNTLSAEELAAGWILLFDGQTTYGWEAASEVDWTVADGVITATRGKPGLLNTTTSFADYELKVDFRAAKGTNSGVFLRTAKTPKDVKADCYELNIAPPENAFPTGSFVGRQKVEGAGESDGWRTFEVIAKGPRLLIKLDGKQVLDYADPQAIATGKIGLQFNQGKIEFRNVKLRPLGLESIFNGKDLTGWTVFPGKASVYSVTADGLLNVKNGPGQLESTGKYANFVLQMEIFSNGKHLNSGLFFRSIPGEFQNGYESQIHNGVKDGDRTQPLDFGSGGIYRRQKARQVVSNDFEWFHKTLIASGPHIAVWINGIQVNDWTDPRAPHNNPRQGQRLEAGTFIIQGHDPTTDLSFRQLRVVETPAEAAPATAEKP